VAVVGEEEAAAAAEPLVPVAVPRGAREARAAAEEGAAVAAARVPVAGAAAA